MNPWLTTAEVAPLLNLSRSSVWRMAHGGAIPATALLRSGNRVRISRAWVTGRKAVKS